MNTGSLEDTLWFANAEPGPVYPAPTERAEADVAIVGAGFLGLSTALHLALRGIRVIVLEAHEPGFGASGRSSGFVVPSFVTPLGPDRVREMLGNDCGERICRLVGDSGNLVFDLIRDHAIKCEGEQSGWLQPVHSSARIAFLEQRQSEWSAQGKSLELLDRRGIRRLTGMNSYHAALLDRTGGQLNSLGFVRGLAKAALSAGATIWTGTRVEEIRKGAQRWELRCRDSLVSAECVVLATNALDSTLASKSARSRLPVVFHQIATSPLDAANRERILPENQCLTDTRRDMFAFRWTVDGRLITGGLPLPAVSSQRVHAALRRRLLSMVPVSGPCEIDYGWRGVIAISRHLLPQVTEVDNGLFTAVGCCGRGIALSTALGRELAAFLYSGDPNTLSVPTGPSAPLPGRALLRHLPALLLPWFRMRDRMEGD